MENKISLSEEDVELLINGKLTIGRSERLYYRNDNGQFHRDDGPAVISPNGLQAWYQWDKLHRDNGPALTHTDGTQVWYHHGTLHREDGPAFITPEGKGAYWLYGKQVEPF